MESASSKKYNFVYQTVNTINGKTYIGVHSTNNMNDGYIGCGIYRESDAVRELNKKGSNSHFIKAVVKYGYGSFKRYELCFFDNIKDAYDEERFIVNEKWVKDKTNYNSTGGGKGRPFNKLTDSHQKKLVDIHSREYVVYDKELDKTYFVKNLHKFCRDNNIKNAIGGFCNVLSGRTLLCKKRYWICKLEDWKGHPEIRDKKDKKIPFKKYLIKILTPDGKEHLVNNISKYCKENNLDPSAMYKLAKGRIDDYKGYTIKEI